jgi:hypothetical protein
VFMGFIQVWVLFSDVGGERQFRLEFERGGPWVGIEA